MSCLALSFSSGTFCPPSCFHGVFIWMTLASYHVLIRMKMFTCQINRSITLFSNTRIGTTGVPSAVYKTDLSCFPPVWGPACLGSGDWQEYIFYFMLCTPCKSSRPGVLNRGEISPMGEILRIQGGNESVWKLLSFQNWWHKMVPLLYFWRIYFSHSNTRSMPFNSRLAVIEINRCHMMSSSCQLKVCWAGEGGK